MIKKKKCCSIPSLKEFQNSLENIKNNFSNKEQINYSNKLETVNNISKTFLWNAFYHEKINSYTFLNATKSKGVFRARDIKDKFDICNPKMYEMRPQSQEIELMRCNLPGTSVFYGACDPRTSIFEKLLSNNEEIKKTDIAVSKWIFKKKDLIKFTIVDMENILSNSDFIKKLNWQQSEKDLFENYLSFFSNLFLSEQHLLTAWFSEKHFLDYKTDVIVYPSFQTDGKGINLAIYPRLINQNVLKLKSVYILKASMQESRKNFNVNTFDKMLNVENGKLLDSKLSSNEIQIKFESDFS